MQSVFAGLIAGTLEAVVTMPFEVIKTRQQIGIQTKTSSTLIGAFKEIVKKSGIQGLYIGLPVVMIQTAGKVGVRFGTYDTIKSIANNIALAGIVAGCVEAAFWITPCERIKVLLIKHSARADRFSFTVKTLYQEGVRSLYRGATPTIIRNGGSVGFRFVVFEKIEPHINNPALSGAVVGGLSTILNNPFDVVKSSMQASQNVSRSFNINDLYKSNTLKEVRTLINSHGVRYLLTAGLAARLIKITSGQAVIFFTVEHLKKHW